MTDGGGEKEGNTQPSVCKYIEKRTQFGMPLTCQSCALPKLLSDVVPLAVAVNGQLLKIILLLLLLFFKARESKLIEE